MPRTPAISNEAIITKLKDAGEPLTATQVGVPTSRLKGLDGVVVAGTQQTGQRGRPSLLFTTA